MKLAPYHCVCLWFSLVHLAFSQNDSFRIVDGERATQGEFPFVVSLLDENLNQLCTASILNDNTILTVCLAKLLECITGPNSSCAHLSGDLAAHCLKGLNGSKLSVYVGHVDLSRINLENVYKGKQAIVHEHFNHVPVATADFGVLKLEKKISYDTNTQQACLPTAENVPDEENCIAIGWGDSILQKLNMRLKETCKGLYDPKRVLCAVGAKGKGGICYGDSGGPLICKAKSEPSRWLQYGVSSYIDDLKCQGGSYFMKVSQYLQWIQKHAQD